MEPEPPTVILETLYNVLVYRWQVLASLVDSRGAISVPGFYDDVRGGMLDAALARLEATAEFDLASYQAALGIPSFIKDTSKRCSHCPEP